MGVCEQGPLFVGGQDSYNTYRIPALCVSRRGTVLAFAEGRKYEIRDHGEVHLVLKRSLDGGRTWGPLQIVLQEKDVTCGNPCPVVDRNTGAIWLPFCRSEAFEGSSDGLAEGKATRTVWVTGSHDDGLTWTMPVDITARVKQPDWTWYATGPGHGIQLRTGRLIVPCDHTAAVNWRADDPNYGHVFYSDDAGRTWALGGTVAEYGCNENQVVETMDGALYMNSRNVKEVGVRACAWSRDGVLTFGPRQLAPELIEPTLWAGCEASLVRLTSEAEHDRNRILFANPAWPKDERRNMTVRISYDECCTWSGGRVLHAGPSAYSDLAVALDMDILCLYERGDQHPYQTLTLARFDLEWLTDGQDRRIARREWRG
jgi:sialidase-1